MFSDEAWRCRYLVSESNMLLPYDEQSTPERGTAIEVSSKPIVLPIGTRAAVKLSWLLPCCIALDEAIHGCDYRVSTYA